MSAPARLHHRANFSEYEEQARALLDAVTSGDEASQWRFAWLHPRFRGKSVSDVKAAALQTSDAQTLIAAEYGFESWEALHRFTKDVSRDSPIARFEDAAEAIVAGDAAALRSMLQKHPELIRARSTRRHHATLLHYIAANGVEDARQKTPPNAVEIATILLDAGAEPVALADMYDHKCTTMSMLVSSGHPARAGLQAKLAELLLERGAALDGPGTDWQSAIMTALAFGYRDTAEAISHRPGAVIDLPAAAGLGRVDEIKRLLPSADARSRHVALALAAQHGHVAVVRLLLDAGEDPSRYNPEGFHAHSTPLHQAVWSNHMEVVRLLVERGARLDLRDKVYDGTPLGWAEYGKRDAIVQYLRERGAPS